MRMVLSALLAIVAVGSGALVARERSPAYSVLPDDSFVVRRLSGQIRARVPRDQVYLLDTVGYRSFGSVGFGVVWNLVRHGYDVRVLAGDPYLGSAHGLPRRAPVARLLVVSSPPGYVALPEAVRVADFTADHSMAARLARSEAAVLAQLEQRPPSITAFGRRNLEGAPGSEVADGLRTIAEGRRADWRPLLHSHVLRGLVLARMVSLPAEGTAALTRFDELLSKAEDAFFSVFVIPPPT